MRKTINDSEYSLPYPLWPSATERHYGPGAHPGTGTPQEVHGEESEGGGRIKFRPSISPKAMVEERYKLSPDVWGANGDKGLQNSAELRDWLAKRIGGKVIYGDWAFEEFGGLGKALIIEGSQGNIAALQLAESWEGISVATMEVATKGEGFGTEVMKALTDYARMRGRDLAFFRISNQRFFNRFEWDSYDGMNATYEVEPLYRLGRMTEEERNRLTERHYGPGPHPGTGTPQEVHVGDRGGAAKSDIPDDIRRMTFYHGTRSEIEAQSILAHGQILPGATEQGRAKLAPVVGMAYATSDIEEAVIYALGAEMAGHEMPPKWIGDDGRYGYIFEIDMDSLDDLQPDEDSIGNAVSEGRYEWLNRMARHVLTENQQRRVQDGFLADWAQAGKKLVKTMSPEQKWQLIRDGANIANAGSLGFKRVWVLDKTKSQELPARYTGSALPKDDRERLIFGQIKLVESSVIRAMIARHGDHHAGVKAERHYGPGPHPGTGTPQEIHAHMARWERQFSSDPPEGMIRVYRGVNPERNRIASRDPSHGHWYTTDYYDAVSYANWDYEGGGELGPGRAVLAMDVPIEDAFEAAQAGSRHRIEDIEELFDPERPVEMYFEDISGAGFYEGDLAAALIGGLPSLEELGEMTSRHGQHVGQEGTPEGGSKPGYTHVPGSVPGYTSEIYVAVDGQGIPPGSKAGDLYLEQVRQPSGAPIRGTTMALNDERIPEWVYHMTTNLPGISGANEISARGVGGLGGDERDEIVSLTISEEIAKQLTHDMRLAIQISQEFFPTEPDYRFNDETKEWEAFNKDTGETITSKEEAEWHRKLIQRINELDKPSTEASGWEFRGGPVNVLDEDHTPHYGVHDWFNQYFIARESHTDALNPVFYTDPEVLMKMDPAKVGYARIPKANLRTGALLTDFDLGNRFGLKEIRLYGDVPLTGAEFVERHGQHIGQEGTPEGGSKKGYTHVPGSVPGSGTTEPGSDKPKPRRTPWDAAHHWDPSDDNVISFGVKMALDEDVDQEKGARFKSAIAYALQEFYAKIGVKPKGLVVSNSYLDLADELLEAGEYRGMNRFELAGLISEKMAGAAAGTVENTVWVRDEEGGSTEIGSDRWNFFVHHELGHWLEGEVMQPRANLDLGRAFFEIDPSPRYFLALFGVYSEEDIRGEYWADLIGLAASGQENPSFRRFNLGPLDENEREDLAKTREVVRMLIEDHPDVSRALPRKDRPVLVFYPEGEEFLSKPASETRDLPESAVVLDPALIPPPEVSRALDTFVVALKRLIR